MKVELIFESGKVINCGNTINEAEKSNQKELDELYNRLKRGKVNFEYTKKDGSTRKAFGTLKSDLLPKRERPALKKYTKSEETFCYYDLDADGWRSFRKENFLKISD